jgi:hypothetical protein
LRIHKNLKFTAESTEPTELTDWNKKYFSVISVCSVVKNQIKPKSNGGEKIWHSLR